MILKLEEYLDRINLILKMDVKILENELRSVGPILKEILNE